MRFAGGLGRDRTSQLNQPGGYQTAAPKSIIDLQPFRQSSSLPIKSADGMDGTARLIDLNPAIHVWYLLTMAWKDGSESSYHLENPEPRSRRLILNPKFPSGLEVLEGKVQYRCVLFGAESGDGLIQASSSQRIYAPLCDGRIYLRNPAKGHRTSLEAAAEFLRTQVWGGEKVIVLFHHLLEDTHRETGEIYPEDRGRPAISNQGAGSVPVPADVDGAYEDRLLTPTDLGIALENEEPSGLHPGKWYPAAASPGIYVSVIEPGLIAPAILESYKATVNALDRVEASSLCYLVAFDLDDFDLAYSLGTEHPAVDWSEHIQPGIKNASLPGPDGIGNISPLVSTGLINPENARRTVATFTGGFKREHGAFKYGEFASKNYGSHYGFLQEGVIFSKLQPGLATIGVLSDGTVRMGTWSAQDDRTLAKVRFARQNGVPLVEFDDQSQLTRPGRLVNRWGAGNWSGSEDMKLRTIRSGAAIQVNGTRLFLIYAVFSDATPSAMARVFQAYHCRYGMLLDMNALEHTYLALYRRKGEQLFVDHLIIGMSQVEQSDSNGPVPRFLGYPDNRDFFYVMRRTQ